MVHWYQWYDWWARNATIVVKKVNSRGLAFTWVQAHIAVNSESVDIINYYIQYGWRITRYNLQNRQIIHEFNAGAPTLNKVIDHNSKQHRTQFCALRNASI